jgi:hypothetical protein
MPDPKDNAKASGDVHPPEVEQGEQQRPRGRPDAQGAHGDAKGGTLERDLEDEGRAGRGENQAGFLKEKDGEAGRNS